MTLHVVRHQRAHTEIKATVPAAARRVLCKGDTSAATLMALFSQYPWKLFLWPVTIHPE